MKLLLIIGAGSFLGGIMRYLFSLMIQSRILSTFPYGTLSVNLIGCFVIGVVFALSEKTNMSGEWRMFLATGICGGFTTFSAFSHETFGLLRDGQFFSAGMYVAASVILGLVATFLGYTLLKLL
jgi:CrcB protein